jgi:leukotriene-A4 hydrolase
LQAWFYGEGLQLPVEITYDTTLANDAYALATRWNQSRDEQDPSKLVFNAADLKDFNSNQKGGPLLT